MKVIDLLSKVGESKRSTFETRKPDNEIFSEAFTGFPSQELMKSEDRHLYDLEEDEMTPEQKEKADKILAEDMPQFAIELIENYLKRHHPESILDRETLKILNIDYLDDREYFTLRDLLAGIGEDREAAKDKSGVVIERDFCSVSFVIKDLIGNDQIYTPLDGLITDVLKSAIIGAKNIGITIDDPAIKELKNRYKQAQKREDEAFSPDNFIDFGEAVLTSATRRKKLYQFGNILTEITARELEEQEEPILLFRSLYEPGQHINTWDGVIRAFCLEASKSDYNDLYDVIIENDTPDKQLIARHKIPNENSAYNSTLVPYPYDDDESYLISKRGANPELRATIIFCHPDGQRAYISPRLSNLLNVLNTIYALNGYKPRVVPLAEVYRELHESNKPTKKQLEGLRDDIKYLKSLVCYRVLIAKDKNMDKEMRLDPDHLENLDYFASLPGYSFTKYELLWAMQDKDVLSVRGMGHYALQSVKNGIYPLAFKLMEQPIMNKLAEDKNQYYYRDARLLKATKSEKSISYMNALQRELQDRKSDLVFNFKDFLIKHHLVDDPEDLHDKRKMYRERQYLADQLNLLYSLDGISNYTIIKETGDFSIERSLPDLAGLSQKKRDAILKKHKEQTEKTYRKFREKQEGRKEVTQIVSRKGRQLKTRQRPKFIEIDYNGKEKHNRKTVWMVTDQLD